MKDRKKKKKKPCLGPEENLFVKLKERNLWLVRKTCTENASM